MPYHTGALRDREHSFQKVSQVLPQVLLCDGGSVQWTELRGRSQIELRAQRAAAPRRGIRSARRIDGPHPVVAERAHAEHSHRLDQAADLIDLLSAPA